MKEGLLEAYKRLTAELAGSLVEEQNQRFYKQLETLDDPTEDLDLEFMRYTRKKRPGLPVYWLSIIRTVKYSMNLKQQMLENYEIFVNAYENLSHRTDLNPNEHQLLQEIGDYLYNVDDLAGDADRLYPKLITGMREAMKRAHGVIIEPGPELYEGKLTSETKPVLEDALNGLIEICFRFKERIQIETGLLRMIRLIVK